MAHWVPAGGLLEGMAWEPGGSVQAVELVGLLVGVVVLAAGCWAVLWVVWWPPPPHDGDEDPGEDEREQESARDQHAGSAPGRLFVLFIGRGAHC